MNKLYDLITFHNLTTPALNEDNLNAMSQALDAIDDRVVNLGGAVLEVIPDLEDILSNAEQLEQYRNDAVAAASDAEDDKEDAEAYAVGTRNGVPVTSGDPAYHNNAKYYSEQTDPTAFANMSDVDFDNLQNGQVPVWNASSRKWENGSGGGGGSSASQVSYDNTISGLTATDVQDAIDEVYGATQTAMGIWTAAVTAQIGDEYVDITNAAISSASTCILTPSCEDVLTPEETESVPVPKITITDNTHTARLHFKALERSMKFRLHIMDLS